MFNAILLNKNDDGSTAAQLTQLDDGQLPADGDVTVRVDYSTINYKDALAIGHRGQGAGRAYLANGARHRWSGGGDCLVISRLGSGPYPHVRENRIDSGVIDRARGTRPRCMKQSFEPQLEETVHATCTLAALQ